MNKRADGVESMLDFGLIFVLFRSAWISFGFAAAFIYIRP